VSESESKIAELIKSAVKGMATKIAMKIA